MDIWFWVNDWYSWVGIYMLGVLWGGRKQAKLFGKWVIDRKTDELIFEFDANKAPWPELACWFWPIIFLYCLVEGKYSVGLFAGKPPKELKRTAHERKIERLLEE